MDVRRVEVRVAGTNDSLDERTERRDQMPVTEVLRPEPPGPRMPSTRNPAARRGPAGIR